MVIITLVAVANVCIVYHHAPIIDQKIYAKIIANQKCIVGGLNFAEKAFKISDKNIKFKKNTRDGREAGSLLGMYACLRKLLVQVPCLRAGEGTLAGSSISAKLLEKHVSS